jgi:DNA primase
VISPETIALIRERTDLVALVQESVPTLKKRGRAWTGLCPFHKEKSPSFNVNQERGFYKCFGCGEAGDAFTFVMKELSYSFTEAAHYLAERAQIVIEEESRERSEIDRVKKQRDDLYSANAVAATFFEEQLRKHPLRSFALEELARRGIVPGENAEADEALKAFRIGYAPHEWEGLATFFRQQGISPVAAEAVGLITPRSSGSGHYDRFRHRLMFAVLDTQGRVVAFSGRALRDPPNVEPRPGAEKPAKYINSKESPIYTKGNVLFGLFQARHAIRAEELAILVEGNFDVFSLHARGLANVVAPLGTAFTPEQAKLLKRYAPRLVLLFDSDAAGRKATFASRKPCAEAGLLTRVARLPEGKDPDDFVRLQGAAALKACVKQGRGLLVSMIDAELDDSFGEADLHEKLARVERIADLIASEEDPLVRLEASTHADSVVAGRLDILGAESLRVLHAKLRAKAREAQPRHVPQAAPAARSTPKSAASAVRRDIVGALLDFPGLLEDPGVQEVFGLLEGPAALTVAALRKAHTHEKGLDTAEFLAQIPPAIQSFAGKRLCVPEHETEGRAKEALLASAKQLERLILADEQQQITREMHQPDHGEQERLLAEIQERKSREQGINARTTRTSGLGATPHEERPFEEARDEDRGEGATEGGEGGPQGERSRGAHEDPQRSEWISGGDERSGEREEEWRDDDER